MQLPSRLFRAALAAVFAWLLGCSQNLGRDHFLDPASDEYIGDVDARLIRIYAPGCTHDASECVQRAKVNKARGVDLGFRVEFEDPAFGDAVDSSDLMVKGTLHGYKNLQIFRFDGLYPQVGESGAWEASVRLNRENGGRNSFEVFALDSASGKIRVLRDSLVVFYRP